MYNDKSFVEREHEKEFKEPTKKPEDCIDLTGSDAENEPEIETVTFVEDATSVDNAEDVITVEEDEEQEEDPDESGPVSKDLLNGPLGSLWKGGGTVPLVKPADGISTENILMKLSQATEQDCEVEPVKSNDFKITYDIYLPGVRFKKSKARVPNYRVVVVKSQKLPTEADLVALNKNLKDGVPILFAICNNDNNISFYCFSPVNLPTLISMG